MASGTFRKLFYLWLGKVISGRGYWFKSLGGDYLVSPPGVELGKSPWLGKRICVKNMAVFNRGGVGSKSFLGDI